MASSTGWLRTFPGQHGRPRPGRPVAPPARPAPVSPARSKTGRTGLTVGWWVWGTAVSVNVVIWLLVSILGGEDVYFWPAWVAGPWGVVLLMMTLASRRFDRGR